MRSTSEVPQNLALRFQQGDDDALREMYRLYSGPMFVTALSLVGDREMAAEAVQQAFVQAWRAAENFDASRALQPWLYAITRRTAIDVYRRNKKFAGLQQLEVVRENAATHETTGIERAWQAWQVRRALDELPQDEREVLRLAYFDGMTQSEVSMHLGVPLGTVKSRTARAQRRLAVALAHLLDEDHSGSATVG
ncbi:RNA polymerase sigma factor [Streptomyces cinereoruber]|uniref:RNA polymerase sigma factor n=1 Tax=Streptomyces cinereoruber TaxID=67260 RepID=UPI0036256791